jgi:hypothetical protein
MDCSSNSEDIGGTEMVALSIDGLVTSLRMEYEHLVNPMSVYARLVDLGVSAGKKGNAMRCTKWYDNNIWPYVRTYEWGIRRNNAVEP